VTQTSKESSECHRSIEAFRVRSHASGKSKFSSRKIIALRKKLGLTKAALARRLGVNVNTLWRGERGEEPFTIGSFRHKATHYVMKVEIGAITGFLAHLLGKQSADTHVWVLAGEAAQSGEYNWQAPDSSRVTQGRVKFAPR